MDSRKLKLTSLDGFADDVNALPDLKTKRMALDMLVLVRDGKVAGVPLGNYPTTDKCQMPVLFFKQEVLMIKKSKVKTVVIKVPATPQQVELIDRGASAANMDLNSFILNAVCAQAERDVLAEAQAALK